MKAYKAFLKQGDFLIGKDFQYEIGKTYVYENELILSKQGFHFCKSVDDCLFYYLYSKQTVICEVEVSGKILGDGHKYVTDKIKIYRELTLEDLSKSIKKQANTIYFLKYNPSFLDAMVENFSTSYSPIYVKSWLEIYQGEDRLKLTPYLTSHLHVSVWLTFYPIDFHLLVESVPKLMYSYLKTSMALDVILFQYLDSIYEENQFLLARKFPNTMIEYSFSKCKKWYIKLLWLYYNPTHYKVLLK